MKESTSNIKSQVGHLFSTPVGSGYQWGIIAVVACMFIFMPQHQPNDWDLNANGLWSEGLDIYQNPDRVYPPWSLLLLVPYYLVGAAGSRVLSVIVVGWLAQFKGWPLSSFLAAVLSPYFLVTMTTSNMDIFVLVLPLLLWDSVENTNWQTLGRGLALSIYLLKPQGALLIWVYLLWSKRASWRSLIMPLLLTAGLVIPVSLLGTPPLILQWLDNISQPSPQNAYFWSINNLSLSSFTEPLSAVLIVGAAYTLLKFIFVWRGERWTRERIISGLLFLSMFLSPYTSQQSFSAALAFIPSWKSVLFQLFILFIAFNYFVYWDFIPLWLFSIAFASMYFYRSAGAPAASPSRR